jgi:uncharacterized glyoxalase superfamily protein PhnB
MPVKPIPDDYHAITPYLIVKGVARLIDFVERAFDAELVHRTDRPDGSVMHAEVRIRDSRIMMGEARDEWPAMPTTLYLYVEDADAAYARALGAGAQSVHEPADMFYGDRQGGIKDPSGNLWWIATHIEDVAPDELKRRAEAFAAQGC